MLGELCWRSAYYWQDKLDGKILPALTRLFQEHWRICLYFLLFPWLGLVSLPLLFPLSEPPEPKHWRALLAVPVVETDHGLLFVRQPKQ